MATYQVKDWENIYENAESRKLKKCGFVCVPNTQQGMGLLHILGQKNGAAIYGIFNLIIGSLSQQSPTRAGWMTDDGTETGKPWSESYLSVRYGRPIGEIREALQVLSSSEVGWIAEFHREILPTYRENPPVEGKGREGNRSSASACPPVGDAPAQKPESESHFTHFWQCVPRMGRERSSRKQAASEWTRMKCDGIAETVMAGLKAWKASEAWTKDGGQFVPGIHRWLKNRQWENIPEPAAANADENGFVRVPLSESQLDELLV
jgi:hypothetical protein